MSQMSPEEEEAVQAELLALQKEAMPNVPEVPEAQRVELPSVPVEAPQEVEAETSGERVGWPSTVAHQQLARQRLLPRTRRREWLCRRSLCMWILRLYDAICILFSGFSMSPLPLSSFTGEYLHLQRPL